jgi:hypothetical protein
MDTSERERQVFKLVLSAIRHIAEKTATSGGFENLSDEEKKIVNVLSDGTVNGGSMALSLISLMARDTVIDDKEYGKGVDKRANELRKRILEAIYEVYRDTGIVVKEEDGITLKSDNVSEVIPVFDEIFYSVFSILTELRESSEIFNVRSMKALEMLGIASKEITMKEMKSRNIDEMFR